MQLYLIRHAQSFNNTLQTGYQHLRHQDPPLTELGLLQADRLADYIARPSDPATAAAAGQGDPQNRAGFGLTHLYSSLMTRAVTTGSRLAERLGLPLHAWEDWHEEGGIYLDDEAKNPVGQPGLGRSDFARDFPRLVLPEQLTDAGWWNRPYEAEAARPERARRVLARLLEQHGAGSDNVAVVTHGGFYNHFMGALLGLTPPFPLHYLTNNTGISRISFGPHGRHVVYHNRCEHLPAELITY